MFIEALAKTVKRDDVSIALSLPLNVFGKSADCPSSQALLAFRCSRTTAETTFVESHLEQCEFCRAEIQLLEFCPGEPESVSVMEIPPHLRTLAESILRSLVSEPGTIATG